MENSCFTITVVRHGETNYNSSPVVQSDAKTDEPLNENGLAQANLLGVRLEDELFTKAFSSHLIRAKETAECILAKSNHQPPPKLSIDERLREREKRFLKAGTPFVDWARDASRWSSENNQPAFRYDPTGTETYLEVNSRAISFCEELCQQESETGNSNGEEHNVLVVSHGLWILAILDYLMHSEEFKFDAERSVPKDQVLKNLIKNTAVTKIRIFHQLESDRKRKFQVIMLNEYSHLESVDVCRSLDIFENI